MASSGKGKGKKHQGKSNAYKYNPISKQHGTCKNTDKSEEYGDRTVPPIMLKDLDEKNTPSKTSIQMMLEGGIADMKQKSSTSTAPLPKGNVTFVANPKVNCPNSLKGKSSVDSDEFENLDFVISLANCPNEINLEDWLATCSDDSRDYLVMNLIRRVEFLTTQVKLGRDCARKLIIQTTKRFNDSKIQLRNMRLQNNERESLLKQKEELDSFNSMLTEKENYLRMVNRELDRVSQAIKRLEAWDQQIEVTNEVRKLCMSESKEALLETQKKDRELLKMSKDIEKQIVELKREFVEERRKIVELEQKLKQLNEEHEHTKATPSFGW